METSLKPGMTFDYEKVSEARESAAALGSGGLEVFSTPSLVALFEITAKRGGDALLPEGHSTVGIDIHVKHLKATKIGKKVRCTVTLATMEGKKLTFSGEMWDEDGKIGEGTHVRYVVNDAEFMKRLG